MVNSLSGVSQEPFESWRHNVLAQGRGAGLPAERPSGAGGVEDGALFIAAGVKLSLVVFEHLSNPLFSLSRGIFWSEEVFILPIGAIPFRGTARLTRFIFSQSVISAP